MASVSDKKSGLDNEPIHEFDLQKYLGKWYEIARYEHTFEKGLSACTAEYSLRDDGKIKVFNTGFDSANGKRNEIIGKAKTTDTVARLRVSFFWFFYSDYRVLALGDNYSWSLVGGSTDKYLWILSRTEKLPQEELDKIIAEAQRRGYDTSRLHFN